MRTYEKSCVDQRGKTVLKDFSSKGTEPLVGSISKIRRVEVGANAGAAGGKRIDTRKPLTFDIGTDADCAQPVHNELGTEGLATSRNSMRDGQKRA